MGVGSQPNLSYNRFSSRKLRVKCSRLCLNVEGSHKRQRAGGGTGWAAAETERTARGDKQRLSASLYLCVPQIPLKIVK